MLDHTPTAFDLLRLALILVVTGIAVVTDIRFRRIPNALTFPAMAVGIVLNGVFGGVDGLLRGSAGFGLGVALFLIPVAFMGRGAGDLKLLAALGAIGGPVFVLWCALFASIAGGVFGLATLIARRQAVPVLTGLAIDLSTRQMPVAASGIRMPYAVPMAVGAVAALVVV